SDVLARTLGPTAPACERLARCVRDVRTLAFASATFVRRSIVQQTVFSSRSVVSIDVLTLGTSISYPRTKSFTSWSFTGWHHRGRFCTIHGSTSGSASCGNSRSLELFFTAMNTGFGYGCDASQTNVFGSLSVKPDLRQKARHGTFRAVGSRRAITECRLPSRAASTER